MIKVRTRPDGVVELSGRLDAAGANDAREALDRLAGPLTLECSGLDYISSAGLGLIMITYKRMHDAGLAFRMTGLLPRVRAIFTYAGLDRILTLE